MTSRREFLTLAALSGAVLATGCTTTGSGDGVDGGSNPIKLSATGLGESHAALYARLPDGKFVIPAVPYERVPEQFRRQIVRNNTGERPGTIVVETGKHFLHYTYPGGRAIRYGVGLGRAGFEWQGEAVMQWKRAWPTWTPPEEMIDRQPELRKYSAANGGMKPGLSNPLGARALYIFQDGRDTLYRLHGSPEWSSIGKSVSSGCVRMINQDIVDLYARVPGGTRIVVR